MQNQERKSSSDEKSDDMMIYIENDGALFRGKARTLPTEVWSAARRAWKPYEGGEKPVEWGNLISESEAKTIMAEAE